MGFKKRKPEEKTGVKTCSAFIFALRFEELFVLFYQITLPPLNMQKTIIDEYGHEYTWEEFLGTLCECPVQFIDERVNWG